MPSYFGPIGRLVPIRMISSISTAVERSSSSVVTLGGIRKMYVGPRAHREWNISLDGARPSEVAPLLDFAEGRYGRGPFWWIDSRAHYTNVLPPRSAAQERLWRNTTRGGSVILPDGTHASQSLVAWGSTYADLEPGSELRIPVVPGVAVTGSAWLGGANQATRVEIRDAADQVLDFAHVFRTGSGLQRTAATVTPGAGAHHCVLRFINPGRIVNPALTFTADMTEWGPGRGCDKAAITGVTGDVLHEQDTHSRLLESASCKVQEVGP